jgi:hypothetical protein
VKYLGPEMVDEAFEGIRLSGEQRPSQFGFSQLVHALDCSAIARAAKLFGTITKGGGRRGVP